MSVGRVICQWRRSLHELVDAKKEEDNSLLCLPMVWREGERTSHYNFFRRERTLKRILKGVLDIVVGGERL